MSSRWRWLTCAVIVLGACDEAVSLDAGDAGAVAGNGGSGGGGAGSDDAGGNGGAAGGAGDDSGQRACAWIELTPKNVGPGPRRFGSGLYDAVGHRAIVIGGLGDGGAKSDMWALSLTGEPTWTDVTLNAPSGQDSPYAGNAVIDGRRILVVAGTTLFSWNLDDPVAAWAPFPTEGAANVKRTYAAQTMALDPPGHRLVFFGGYLSSGAPPDSPYELALSNPPVWSNIAVPTSTRSAGGKHLAAYDAPRRRLVVYSDAYSGIGTPPRTHLFDLSLSDPPGWAEFTADGPAPPSAERSSAAYDPIAQRLVVFSPGALDYSGNSGGAAGAPPDGGEDLTSRVYALSLSGAPTWRQLIAKNRGPLWMAQSAIYDEGNDRMLLVGGYRTEYSAEVWALDLASCR